MKPAIIVIAYNRADSLARLLRSIGAANVPDDVPLVISVDPTKEGADTDVVRVAETFEWSGPKRVRILEENNGLKSHVLKCGDLTVEYGAGILLEDDLVVAPDFYSFAVDALNAYTDDDRIAGVALYSPQFEEGSELRFVPIDDGCDVYFIQSACSWGQAWSAAHWRAFRVWFADHPRTHDRDLPPHIRTWPASSWKKHFIDYLVQSDRFFVYPRIGFTTNFHEVGTHHRTPSFRLQVPLAVGSHNTEFVGLDDTVAVYDVTYEILPCRLRRLAPSLVSFDFVVDLYGIKAPEQLDRDYVLTTRSCSNPTRTFGLFLHPQELNVVMEIEGTEISLVRRHQVAVGRPARTRPRVAYAYSIPLRFLWNPALSALEEGLVRTRSRVRRLSRKLPGQKILRKFVK